MKKILFLLLVSSHNHAEIIKSVDFNHWYEGTYAVERLAEDWAPYNMDIGVRQGRVAVVDDMRGGNALKITHHAGKWGVNVDSGTLWHADFAKHKELYFSMRMYFEKDFDPVRSGKMPGLCGGGCKTGCGDVTGTNGWSARYNFFSTEKSDEVGLSVYTYHMDKPGNCGDPRKLGISAKKGEWTRTTQWVKMNDVGKSNGEIKAWVNGELALEWKGLRFVSNSDLIDKLTFTNFYGGADTSYAPSKNEFIYFDDIIISTHFSTDGFNAQHEISPPTPPATIQAEKGSGYEAD